MTKVVNVKVAYIRPQYNNLKEWMEDPDNVYIGRKGIVFVPTNDNKKERWPKNDSIWANPFKITKDTNRETVVGKYKEYITEKIEKIENNPEVYNIELLRGKNLGCWCHPEACHGDVLIELLDQ